MNVKRLTKALVECCSDPTVEHPAITTSTSPTSLTNSTTPLKSSVVENAAPVFLSTVRRRARVLSVGMREEEAVAAAAGLIDGGGEWRIAGGQNHFLPSEFRCLATACDAVLKLAQPIANKRAARAAVAAAAVAGGGGARAKWDALAHTMRNKQKKRRTCGASFPQNQSSKNSNNNKSSSSNNNKSGGGGGSGSGSSEDHTWCQGDETDFKLRVGPDFSNKGSTEPSAPPLYEVCS